jgi:hypothetical protein
MPKGASQERGMSQSRWLGVALSVSLSGCAEAIMGALTPDAKFEHPCADAFAHPAIAGEERGEFRFGTKAADSRDDVAVVVLVPLADPCEGSAGWSSTPRWTPVLKRVDRSKKALITNLETGSDQRVGIPSECQRSCSECVRFELAPGEHTLELFVSTPGSANTDWNYFSGTATFSALPKGLYGVRVCRPDRAKKPLTWIRDERTLKCVSSVCPGGAGAVQQGDEADER